MTAVRIAVKNAPSRYGDGDNDRDIQRIANRGNSIVGCTEVNDHDAPILRPRGFGMWRPEVARSEVLYWDRAVWEKLDADFFKISSMLAPARRYIVHAKLEHRETGIVRNVGVVHLVAFKTSSEKHAREYRHQQERCATWLERHPRGVLIGDFNGTFDGNWLKDLESVGEWHTPKTKSGPQGQGIDGIVTNKQIAHAINARALDGFDGDHKPVEATLPLRKG